MECEIASGGGGEGGDARCLIDALESQVQAATDQLLMTNFPTCLELCHKTAAAVKAVLSGEEGDLDNISRFEKVQESAAVLGIQALAEQGSWRDVIPFVEAVYTHVADCPATIMQMCLLLHAQVREYMICHTLFNTWLEVDQRADHPDSAAIVKVYVTNILAPLGAFNLIPQVVGRCAALSYDERQALLSPAALQQQRLPSLFTSAKISTPPDHNTDLVPLEKSDDHVDKSPREFSVSRLISLYLAAARQFWSQLLSQGWTQQLRKASRLLLIVSFVILALLHIQNDVTGNFSRAIMIWKSAFRSLGSVLTRQPLNQQ